jgi:hypothetical protein
MSEVENKIETEAPPYAIPQSPPVEPQEPARLNALQRLTGTIFSPGETFRDVNRKPTIILPLILAMIVAVAGGAFFSWKVKPDWDHIFRAQIQRQLDKSNQSLTPEQIEQRVTFSKKLVPVFPIIGAVGTVIACLIVSGIFALGMMLIQAKTTFKKILSVVSWSWLGTALVQTVVLIVAIMVQDQETLNSIDPTQGLTIVPSNLGAFLPEGTTGAIKSIGLSLDVFSIWFLVLLCVGFAAIAGARKFTPKKTAGIVFGFWIVWVLLKAGGAAVFGS